jgi:hypothetical protein
LNFLGSEKATGNEDGRPSGFNDQGQLTFLAEFTDGTNGIFVSDMATLPEPSSALILLLGLVAVGSTRFQIEKTN